MEGRVDLGGWLHTKVQSRGATVSALTLWMLGRLGAAVSVLCRFIAVNV